MMIAAGKEEEEVAAAAAETQKKQHRRMNVDEPPSALKAAYTREFERPTPQPVIFICKFIGDHYTVLSANRVQIHTTVVNALAIYTDVFKTRSGRNTLINIARQTLAAKVPKNGFATWAAGLMFQDGLKVIAWMARYSLVYDPAAACMTIDISDMGEACNSVSYHAPEGI